MIATDPRVTPPPWDPGGVTRADSWSFRLLTAVCATASVWYFAWLLQPGRIGNPVLYTLLVLAELFNLVQAIGFWWTCASRRPVVPVPPAPAQKWDVDLFIPVYNEPVEIVEPVVAAAVALRGARVRVAVLDDGNNPRFRDLAARHGAAYLRRPSNRGAKAGNINDALGRTSAPLVGVLDCDHVPGPRFLEATLGHFAGGDVAFVQTPQYYANAPDNLTARAAWSQQALFFGSIANGKAGQNAMFCCGTNVIFRRTALDSTGGFPEDSVTEDFQLSVRLHAGGWRSVYVPEVLAQGLGPEDMPSYVSQQLRWSRGCISAIPHVLRAKLPWRIRLQYLLSASYFLYGWTLVAYLLMPLVRIAFGAQPLASASAADFLFHFAPYFLLSIVAVARAGSGSYSYGAFALAAANFWIGIVSTVRAVLRRPASFVVTPKQGSSGWQPRAVAPALAVAGLLTTVSAWGLWNDPTPGILNACAFAAIHCFIMLRGAAPALRLRLRRRPVPVTAPWKPRAIGRARVVPAPRPETRTAPERRTRRRVS